MTLGEEIVADYTALRLTLRAHPMALIRPRLEAPAARPPSGRGPSAGSCEPRRLDSAGRCGKTARRRSPHGREAADPLPARRLRRARGLDPLRRALVRRPRPPGGGAAARRRRWRRAGAAARLRGAGGGGGRRAGRRRRWWSGIRSAGWWRSTSRRGGGWRALVLVASPGPGGLGPSLWQLSSRAPEVLAMLLAAQAGAGALHRDRGGAAGALHRGDAARLGRARWRRRPTARARSRSSTG